MVNSTLLQETYIQKSRVFLLPLIGIKKDKHYIPTNTYVSSADLVSTEYPNGIKRHDQILIVTYPKFYAKKDEDLYSTIRGEFGLGTDSSGEEILGENTMTGWEKYKFKTLMSNQNFMAVHESEDDIIFTFNLSKWSSDWNCFVKGRYSLFGEDAKKAVIHFRWKDLYQIEQKKLFCYLYPYKDECLREFAKEIDISIKELAEVKELCSKPNFSLEDYKFNFKVYEGQD